MNKMAIEAGGKCGLCAADEKTRKFLERYGRSDEYAPLAPDSEADYASEIVIAAGDIEPQIAAPHRVDNVSPVGEYETPAGAGLYRLMHQRADRVLADCRTGTEWVKGCCGDVVRGISCEQERALADYPGGCNCNTC